MTEPVRPAAPAVDPPPAEAAAPPAPTESYHSEALFGDRKEILIYHNQEVYRLRRTRLDKLILYK